MTMCKHLGCYECLLQIANSRGNCPTCQKRLLENQIIRMPKQTGGEDHWWMDKSDDEISENEENSEPSEDEVFRLAELRKTWSSKLTAIVDITDRHFESSKNGKLVIVSQFTRFLGAIGKALKECRKGYKMMLFTGATTEEKRRQLIHDFQRRNKNSKEIMLLSLGSGCVGLNLTAANTMIISEPNWNPGREAQCQDRIYRIGQTRPVTIYKLYVQGTIERKMLALQKSKRNVMELACANMDGGADGQDQTAQARRLEEVRAILNHIFLAADYTTYTDPEDEVDIDELGEKIAA